MQTYWWRGYVDGDGCFYLGLGCNQLSFVGPFDQDWTFVENLGSQLGVAFVIRQVVTARASHSVARLSSFAAIQKVGDYIYAGLHEFGLSRKREKFNAMVDRSQKSAALTAKRRGTEGGSQKPRRERTTGRGRYP